MEAKKIKKAIADLGQKEVTFESISEKLNGQLGDLSRFVGKSSKKNTQLDPVSAKLFSDFAQKYFKNYYTAVQKFEQNAGKELEVSTKLIKFENLFELGKSIAGAVLQERFVDEDEADFNVKWNERPYFPQYTNDIIAAYACSVISSEELAPLAKMIEDKSGKLDKDLIDSLAKEESVVRLVPFSANRKIPSYGATHYVKYTFSDCVETTLRQFFAVLFSTGTENGTLSTDLGRIPDSSTLLKQFFKTYEEKMGIENLANSEYSQIRDDWANICSGHANEKVLYKQDGGNGYETKSNWGNIIKQICIIMKDYPAMLNEKLQKVESTIEDDSDTNVGNGEVISRRQKAAARQIVEVLNKLHSDDFSVTTPLVNSAGEVLTILNNLLGIRTDVELVGEEASEEELNKRVLSKFEFDGSNVYGTVNVYIQNQPRGVNELFFVSRKGHAFLDQIHPKEIQFSGDAKESLALDPIMQLYKFGEKFAVTAQPFDEFSLESAKYPILDFHRKIKRDVTLGEGIRDVLILDKSHKYISGINRLLRHWHILQNGGESAEKILKQVLTGLSEYNDEEAIKIFRTLFGESSDLSEGSLFLLYKASSGILKEEHPIRKEIIDALLEIYNDPKKPLALELAVIVLMQFPSVSVIDILERMFGGEAPDSYSAEIITKAARKGGRDLREVLRQIFQRYYSGDKKIPIYFAREFILFETLPMIDILEGTDLSSSNGEIAANKLLPFLDFDEDVISSIFGWILKKYYPYGKKIPVDVAAYLIIGEPSVFEFLQRVDFKNIQPTYEEIGCFSAVLGLLESTVCQRIVEGILQYYENNKIKVPMVLIRCIEQQIPYFKLSNLLTYGVDFEGREPTQNDIDVLKKLAPEIVDNLLSTQP